MCLGALVPDVARLDKLGIVHVGAKCVRHGFKVCLVTIARELRPFLARRERKSSNNPTSVALIR